MFYEEIDFEAIENEVSEVTGESNKKEIKSKGNQCYLCDSTEFVQENGMTYCNCCKVLIDEKEICDKPEWRKYNDEEGETDRCSMPVNELTQNTSIKTFISGPRNRSNFVLKLIHSWNAVPYKERASIAVLNYIKTKCSGTETRVIEDAVRIYKIVNEVIITRGQSRLGVIIACVYYSMKAHGFICSIPQLSIKFGVGKDYITVGFNKMNEILLKNRSKKLKDNIDTKPPKITDYVNQALVHFSGLTDEQKEIFREAIDVIKNITVVKRNTPLSSIAGCMALMSKNFEFGLTSKAIASALVVSVSTTVRYCKILEGPLELYVANKKIELLRL